MTLKWNLVAKHLKPHDQWQQKMRQKIAKLEQHLVKFPPDAVHLHVQVERVPKRGEFTVALTLTLPSNTLRSAKTATDPVAALDAAVKALLRELAALKADLRHETSWQRPPRRAEAPAVKPARVAVAPAMKPAPARASAASLEEEVSAALTRENGALLELVRRRLNRDELAGEISRGAIDAASVVDEVAHHALAHPGTRPARHGLRVWFYRLALWDLRRRYRLLRAAERDSVSLDGTKWEPADEETVHGFEVEQPVKMLAEQLEPAAMVSSPVLADQYGLSPEQELEHKDFIEYLQRIAAGWPKVERDVFELHFLEGFAADEVAMIENLTPEETAGTIGVVQLRVRQLMRAAAGLSVERSRVAVVG